MKQLNNKIIAFFIFVSLFLFNCTSDKVGNKVLVDVNLLKLNSSKELAMDFDLEFKSNYFEQNHKIIYYAVSIETSIDKSNSLSYETNHIEIFNQREVETDCEDILISSENRQERFQFRYSKNGEKLKFIINGRSYEIGNMKENYSRFSYPNAAFKGQLNRPIRFVSLSAAGQLKAGEVYNNLEFGCLVYDCKYEVDWDKFFKSREFINSSKSAYAVWRSEQSIAEDKNLSLAKYYIIE